MSDSEHRNSKLSFLAPTQIVVIGYGIIILVGALFLSLPISNRIDGGLNFIDALFTATSAMAVTGLTVVNTARDLTLFGQIVVLLLIQIGGLGLMTISTFFSILLGRRIGLRERLTIMTDLGQINLSGMVELVRHILEATFIIEFIGAILLFLRFQRLMPYGKAIYFAIFHSISAFCNAGFDLFGNNLEGFTTDILVNLVISMLLIIGGIGFVVISEIYHIRRTKRFSLHTEMVLKITATLIVLATVVIFIFEYTNFMTFGALPLGTKILAAFFQGVSPRTAGFNTVPIGLLRPYTLFFMMILMFIGASPGSTGGGIKTTTFGVLIMGAKSLITGKEDIEISWRRLSPLTALNAFVIALLAMLLISGAILVLLITEDATPIQIMFETFSAFGTVGLSTGITPELTFIGKLLIAFTMFSGRLGPMTIALAVGMRARKTKYRYPEEKIMIG